MRIACFLGALLLVASCGGSSSETPPPLEPDPTSFRYTGPRLPRPQDEAPAAPEPGAAEVGEDDLPASPQGKPAAATWGSGRPPRSAPTASALPASSARALVPTPTPAPPASAMPAPVEPAPAAPTTPPPNKN